MKIRYILCKTCLLYVLFGVLFDNSVLVRLFQLFCCTSFFLSMVSVFLVHFLTRLMNGYIRAIFCLSLFCRRCSVSALIFQLLSRYTFLSYPTNPGFYGCTWKSFPKFFLGRWGWSCVTRILPLYEEEAEREEASLTKLFLKKFIYFYLQQNSSLTVEKKEVGTEKPHKFLVNNVAGLPNLKVGHKPTW